MEYILDFFREFQAQRQDLPDWVNLWMRWMSLVFVAGIPFVFFKWGARITIGMMLFLNVPASAFVTDMTGNIDWISVVHLVFWTPVLYYLLTRDVFGPDAKPKSLYGVWAITMSATMAISLGFDGWDTIRLILGTK
ncbi:MAG: hypothetical protein ACPG06_10410 [Alphaproteobacteria bacterium]